MPLSALDRLVCFDAPWKEGLDGHLAGVDEAGRGPLAGPVVAAAVILHSTEFLDDLNDSKKTPPAKREKLYPLILQNAIVGVGLVEESQIDKLNIYQATRLAMKKAVLALSSPPAFVLIDGNMKLDLPIRQKAIVRGDAQSASIAAASIVAKVYRDARMLELDALYPEYGFKKHKGYGTPLHLAKISEMGPCPVHRKSFAPIRNSTSLPNEQLPCGVVGNRRSGDDL